MIRDLVAGLGGELLQGPVVLLILAVLLLGAGSVVVDQVYRWRVRRAGRRKVLAACERAAAERVPVPAQRGPS